MRLHRHLLFTVSLGVLAAAWVACSSNHSGGSGTVDAASDSPLDTTTGDDSSPDCNPCYQMCPCSPGSTSSLVTGSCMVYTCGASGMWMFECLGLGCPDDSGLDAEPQGDGGSEAASDAASDVATDAASD
jgi:hypothetical protein